MDAKCTFKTFLAALGSVAAAVMCFLIGRRSGRSGGDDRSSDIRRVGESVGGAADAVAGMAGESAGLAGHAGEIAAAAGDAEESATDIARRLHDAEELLVRLESQNGQDLNRIARAQELVDELRRRYFERVQKGKDT